jgi:hypothetical protein
MPSWCGAELKKAQGLLFLYLTFYKKHVVDDRSVWISYWKGTLYIVIAEKGYSWKSTHFKKNATV